MRGGCCAGHQLLVRLRSPVDRPAFTAGQLAGEPMWGRQSTAPKRHKAREATQAVPSDRRTVDRRGSPAVGLDSFRSKRARAPVDNSGSTATSRRGGMLVEAAFLALGPQFSTETILAEGLPVDRPAFMAWVRQDSHFWAGPMSDSGETRKILPETQPGRFRRIKKIATGPMIQAATGWTKHQFTGPNSISLPAGIEARFPDFDGGRRNCCTCPRAGASCGGVIRNDSSGTRGHTWRA